MGQLPVPDEVPRDRRYPKKGELAFFDGRFHPHYMRPLEIGAIRVAVAMNYYTRATPESTSPPDLNEYLYGPQ